MNDPVLTSKGHRLHPVSPLFLFIEAIKKSVFPLLIGLFGTKGELQDWIFIGIATLASVMTIIQYWFYHYWLEPDRLVVKDGIFFKSLRQIPYERVQNVNVEKNILHRLFKVATLQLESASGAKPEAVIRVINDVEVQRIKARIKQGSTQDPEPDQEDQSADSDVPAGTLYQMSARDVATYGFISHRALLPIGVVFSVLSQNDYYSTKLFNMMEQQVGALDVSMWSWGQWLLYGLVVGMLALLSIWLVSIVMAFLQLHGFKLQKEDKQIHANMGLLTRISAHVPIKRIQLLRIKSSPLHRFFKRVTIKMETAGGVTEQSGITMSWLAPLISPAAGQQLLSEVQPEIQWEDIRWQPLAPRAWRRMLKRWLLLMALLMLPGLYFYQAWGLLPLALLPLAIWHAKAYVKRAGYAHNDEIIAFRSGVLFHQVAIVKIGKIQNITRMQTPFDRRNQMARVSVDTAGSNQFAQHIDIHYLDDHHIDEIFERLSSQVSASVFVW